MRGVRAPYLMLACYYLQGKQLASGVIGLLTCQSHYNVSGINRTPRARLLLRHPLDQRILTRRCERSVTPASSLTCTAFALTWFLITHTSHSPYIYLTLPSLCVWYCTPTNNKPENSHSLTLSWIIATPVTVCIC